MDSPSWTYANDLRIITAFLGVAMVLFGVDAAVVVAFGIDMASEADVLLAIGVFLLVFTVLLFVPRLRSRGPRSYSLVVEVSMDEAEIAVKEAAEEGGQKVDVAIKESRSARPPRTLTVVGLPMRIVLKAAPYREHGRGSPPWTEIVASGDGVDRDASSKEFRDRIMSRIEATLGTKA